MLEAFPNLSRADRVIGLDTVNDWIESLRILRDNMLVNDWPQVLQLASGTVRLMSQEEREAFLRGRLFFDGDQPVIVNDKGRMEICNPKLDATNASMATP